MPSLHRQILLDPDPREDLESRSPSLGPYTTKGALSEPPLRDLLLGSSRGVEAAPSSLAVSSEPPKPLSLGMHTEVYLRGFL